MCCEVRTARYLFSCNHTRRLLSVDKLLQHEWVKGKSPPMHTDDGGGAMIESWRLIERLLSVFDRATPSPRRPPPENIGIGHRSLDALNGSDRDGAWTILRRAACGCLERVCSRVWARPPGEPATMFFDTQDR